MTIDSAPSRSIPRWDGTRQLACRSSRSGVNLLLHPLAGVIDTGIPVWPAPELAQKLYQFHLASTYDEAERVMLGGELTRYCALQSVHSEDAMTWSVFGPVVYADVSARERWARAMLNLLGLSTASAQGATVSLWRRLPHPETWGMGGPEIDVMLQSCDTVALFEAKWLSGEGSGQGAEGNRSQLELRTQLLEDHGFRRMFRGVRQFASIAISLDGSLGRATTPDGVVHHGGITWADVCDLPEHPCRDELRAHYAWRLQHSKGCESFMPR